MLGQETGMIQAHSMTALTSLLVLRAEVTSQICCAGINSVIICIHLSSQKFDIRLRLRYVVCFRSLE